MSPHLLVTRNDKLGDFMLTWPSLAVLRGALPQARIDVLVAGYTEPIAAICPWIDEVVIDPGAGGSRSGIPSLARDLRARRYDAAITLFSTGRLAAALALARIQYRLAPATKLAQFFYNHRERQRRSRSLKPEWEYNLALVERYLRDHEIPVPAAPKPPFLCFPEATVAAHRNRLCETAGLDPRRRLIFIHPGSGGSASNLSPAQYAQLALALQPNDATAFVVTAGPGEAPIADELTSRLRAGSASAATHLSKEGLVAFAQLLQCADLFIGGSTGPLHIAGALDRPTAGFYPRRRSSTPLRWQTLNSAERRLAFCPPAEAPESDLGTIDLTAAAAEISRRFLSRASDPAPAA